MRASSRGFGEWDFGQQSPVNESLLWESHGREGPDGVMWSLPWGPGPWTPTLRADVLQYAVQVLPADAGRLNELLLRHAAQLQPADVEVAE